MKNFFTLPCFLLINTISAQIDFDKTLSSDPLFIKALKADSAIKSGEFGEVHSLIIIKDGKVVFENYYNGWKRDSIHQLQSATKSVISTLLGCAIQQKFIENTSVPISTYFSSIVEMDVMKSQIRIADLLSQRHGLHWNEGAWTDPNNSWRKVINEEGNWYNKILETPMDTIQGTKFIYSNAAPTLIAGIIQISSGIPIDSFAIKYLFKPLEIDQYWFWQGNNGPRNNGMALISLSPRDMAKLGQLYLQKGRWKNQQILPEDYVIEATSAKVRDVGLNGAYKKYDYGYFWWSNPVTQNGKSSDIFLARGAGGQNIIVNQKDNIVVVTTAWNLQQPNKVQLIYDWYLD